MKVESSQSSSSMSQKQVELSSDIDRKLSEESAKRKEEDKAKQEKSSALHDNRKGKSVDVTA